MMDRLQSEQHFHDQQARQRAGDFRRHPDKLRFDDCEYLQHESWIVPALTELGNLAGKDVLDFGCGHGMASVVLARRGAKVTAFDLSLAYVLEARARDKSKAVTFAPRRARAAANGVRIQFVQADGEHLPFAEGTFDGIWGNAVLHHLDMHRSGEEIKRVLRPGGMAVFCEPWGENPLLNWARGRLPYPGKERTIDETPLRKNHIATLKQIFPIVEIRGFQLLSMVRRVLPLVPVVNILNECDELLLSSFPSLQHFCRYVVITLRR